MDSSLAGKVKCALLDYLFRAPLVGDCCRPVRDKMVTLIGSGAKWCMLIIACWKNGVMKFPLSVLPPFLLFSEENSLLFFCSASKYSPPTPLRLSSDKKNILMHTQQIEKACLCPSCSASHFVFQIIISSSGCIKGMFASQGSNVPVFQDLVNITNFKAMKKGTVESKNGFQYPR